MMKKFLALIMFLFLIAPVAHAAILSFDDISGQDAGGSMPEGYGGFTWLRFNSLNVTTQPLSGYANSNVSGEYVAYGNGGVIGELSVSRSSSFTFNSAYLTAAFRNGLSIEVKGFSGYSEIYSKTVTVDTTVPSMVDFDFIGIDKLTFSAYGGTAFGTNTAYYFAMDNFTFDESVSTVPIPSAILLFGCGLLGLAGVNRRKK
ncbi:MAG: hypothetical protein GY699_15630 [Desulfobacteraceae bacterium]|nr:hypothetical protein [Desulfobacteraceae bacterium]